MRGVSAASSITLLCVCVCVSVCLLLLLLLLLLCPFVCMQEDEDVIKDCIPLVEVEYVRVTGNDAGDQVIDNLAKPEPASAPTKDEKRKGLGKSSTIRTLLSQSSMKEKEQENSGAEVTFVLEIRTRLDGYNSGKTYFFNHSNKDELEVWCEKVLKLSEEAKKVESSMAMTPFERYQKRIADLYQVRFF